MSSRKFFIPTRITIIVFIVLLILFYWVLATNDIRIFPCKTRHVIPNTPEFRDDTCGLGTMYIGVSIIFTPLGYAVEFVILLLLPYLIGCVVNYQPLKGLACIKVMN